MTFHSINTIAATCLDDATIYQLEHHYLPILTTQEKILYKARQSAKRKIQFLASRFLIKKTILKHFNIEFQDIEILYKKYSKDHSTGQPFINITDQSKQKFDNDIKQEINKISISISHTDHYIACAINNKYANIGIDIENHFKNRNLTLIIDKYFSNNEKKVIANSQCQTQCFYRLWCIKEAIYKMEQQTKITSYPHRIFFQFNDEELTDLTCKITNIEYGNSPIIVHFPLSNIQHINNHICCYLYPLHYGNASESVNIPNETYLSLT